LTESILFHGTPAGNILEILRIGKINPGNDGKVYFSRFNPEWVFQYGADRSRGASFVLKLKVFIPDGLEKEYTTRPGVDHTLIIPTRDPLAVEVLELYIRRSKPFAIETIRGSLAIRSALESLPR
jgi:hypothetical protein